MITLGSMAVDHDIQIFAMMPSSEDMSWESSNIPCSTQNGNREDSKCFEQISSFDFTCPTKLLDVYLMTSRRGYWLLLQNELQTLR